ncbi:MAG: hypothetical protein ACOCV1_06275 [Bacillota bacterium]
MKFFKKEEIEEINSLDDLILSQRKSSFEKEMIILENQINNYKNYFKKL